MILRVLVAASVIALGACGQKGPPLAPIVFVPRPVTQLAAKRVEDRIVIQFVVPSANTDGSAPADLRRVEVYAHTGPLPTPADYLKYGDLVASLDIQEPEGAPPGNGEPPAGEDEETAPADRAEAALGQGATTAIAEVLTEKHREIGPMPPVRPAAVQTPAVAIETLETPGTVNFEMPVARFYTVVGVSRSRNRRGPFAGPVRVPLAEPLAPPDAVDVAYDASAITLSWMARPEDVTPVPAPAPFGPPIERETEGTIAEFSDVETEGTTSPPFPVAPQKVPPPAPRFGYNVYEAPASPAPQDAAVSPATAATTAAPVMPVPPLNQVLLTAARFADARVEFGTERCYVVRRVEIVAGVAVESEASAPACVTPVDTFPPAPPRALRSISSAGSVQLLWEANAEADLGGYLVLRGDAPGDTLSPLTPSPITDTSFIDTTVQAGRSYVYAVIAVDRSEPANRSEPSNRVEETIR